MSAVFVDTNVLVYCFDNRDIDKRDRARAWVTACWTRHCGRTSTQVLNEFYSIARRKFPNAISAGDARAEVRRYQNWRPWAVDHPTVETAWAIESRYGINYWDALIVASAQQQACSHVITEDLQHEQRIDSVQILNPFLVGPDVLDRPAP
jgi:predicted nucleic acid-binding protein